MGDIIQDGIYESRCHGDPTRWPENRRVYIQNNSVRLVNYKSVVDPHPERITVFSYASFFDVNTPGPRISDLPENFDIYK